MVIYDPDAVNELLTLVKSKEAHRALNNAVLKLRDLGERLEPPHMKPSREMPQVGCASFGRSRGEATGARSTAGRAPSM
jgi:hypothetical protein